MTYVEQFDLAIACNNKEEADAFMESEIARYLREYGNSEDEASKVILANLGYMAGYYDDATARKINHLFGAVHPIFGCADYHKTVTPKQAWEMGVEAAKKR